MAHFSQIESTSFDRRGTKIKWSAVGTAYNNPCLMPVRTLLPVAIIALFVTGCGSGLSSVSGHITMDGKPLAGAENVAVTVMFYPESGRGAPAAGLADENGDYYVSTGAKEGLPSGNYVVTLSACKFTPPPGGGMPSRKVLTPSRYANPKLSGLRATVQPGRNTFNIELSSSDAGRS
jgi:hypothetical protein